jgi:hypothetical protein
LSRGEILIGFVFHHTDYKWRGGDIRVLSNKRIEDMKVLTDIIDPAEQFCSYFRTSRT